MENKTQQRLFLMEEDRGELLDIVELYLLNNWSFTIETYNVKGAPVEVVHFRQVTLNCWAVALEYRGIERNAENNNIFNAYELTKHILNHCTYATINKD